MLHSGFMRTGLGLFLAAAFGTVVMTTGTALAQTLLSLHEFSVLNSLFVNNDGAFPSSALTIGGSNVLYGTSSQGGENAGGTVFRMGLDGTGFTVLHSFTPTNPATGVSGDGAYPFGS